MSENGGHKFVEQLRFGVLFIFLTCDTVTEAACSGVAMQIYSF